MPRSSAHKVSPPSSPRGDKDAPLRILIIEDDLIFQKIIQTYLQQSSGTDTVAMTADRLGGGLELFDRHGADAVLLDLTLPDSEGLETLRSFREHAPEVPVIVLTGIDDEEIAAEAVRRGAQDFLVKSDLSAPILIRAVRYALERTRAEAALRKSEARFRAVVEDQTELVCRFLPDGRLTFANAAFCRYFGLEPAATSGRNFFALSGAEQADFEAFDHAGTPTRSREQHLVLDDGEPAWIQWTDRALFDHRGRLAELQSVGRDTTEQKQLERQLYQSQKMETLGRLAGGVAHDFNNLLTVIIGCADMLARERKSSGLLPHPQISEIGKAADRAAALTRQLLAVSRRHVAQVQVLDLNQVVHHTEEMLRRLLGERHEVALALDPELPPVKADRGQIEQILVNLVVNARDAMPEGGRIVIETSGGEETAELSVHDAGVGMTGETLEKIFEPFFTTKEAGQGTGLGLSIVDSLVRQSNGSITVESIPAEGSAFRISFPATVEDPVSVDHSSITAGGNEDETRSESVLLVEDEDLVRDMVIALLELQGYKVLGAASAEEALEELGSKKSFDVILTDIVLPGRNGFQLADEVKDRFPGIRILFMSGYADVATGDHGWLESGAQFLQKPFSADELLNKLDMVLRPDA